MQSTSTSTIPDIGTPAFYRNPYPTYRALLDAGTRAVRLAPNYVAVTHYQDCLDVLRDPRLSAVRTKNRLAHLTDEQRRTASTSPGALEAMMLFTDPPQHTRLRQLLHGFFSPESLLALGPRISALLQDLLDGLPVGVEIDFMSSFAHQLPALVIGEILGVPRTHWKELMNWSDMFIEYLATLRPPIGLVIRAERVISEMGSFLEELARERRSAPGDDVISFMLASQQDGEKLSHKEFLSQAMLLLVAGHETTRNLLGNGLVTLLRNEEAMIQLRSDPTMVRTAVEEFLRYEGPLQGSSRIVLQEMELFGEKLQVGHGVYTLLGCANRDSHRFPEPDRLDLKRKNNAHLAFGAGAHVCLGLHLARLEAQIVFPMLLRRFPRIELCDNDLEWSQTLALRGLKELKVVLHDTAASDRIVVS
jgi:pimeloyl-[acyl-carrier protein] synthase